MIGSLSMSRRRLVPEVVQTSAMDCGPAVLKCLLEGFGIAVSWVRSLPTPTTPTTEIVA